MLDAQRLFRVFRVFRVFRDSDILRTSKIQSVQKMNNLLILCVQIGQKKQHSNAK